MKIRKVVAIAGIFAITVTGCSTEEKQETKKDVVETSPTDQVQSEIQKEMEALNQKEGDQVSKAEYDIPITEEQKKDYEGKLQKEAESFKSIYLAARGAGKISAIVSDQTVNEILDAAAKTGEPVTEYSGEYTMRNYAVAKEALTKVMEEKEATFVIDQIDMSGGVYRFEFTYQSGRMTVVQSVGKIEEDGSLQIAYIRKSVVKEFEYTKQGHFLYEITMQNGTELDNGNGIIRIDPLDETCMRYAREYMMPVGYQGTNLFLTDWDCKDLKDLDLNDTFDVFYYIKNRKVMETDNYLNGVPKQEFESMMTTYLGITKEQVEKTASYDDKKKTYQYKQLGCGNYSPDMWGVPEPEVISYKENDDHSITATVQAVWAGRRMEKAFMHEVRFMPSSDGGVKFLSNKIIQAKENDVPKYIHRTK